MPRVLRILMLLLPASAAMAQRGVRPPRSQPQQQPSKPDTTKKIPAGFMLDFQEQDLRLVLSALAEAGGLNVSLANIPSGERATVRMGQPATPVQITEMLRQVSDQHGLKMTESGGLIRIEGPAPVRGAQQQSLAQQLAQAQQAQQQVRVYTYRLKHSSATQLAPVLMNLFSGAGGGQSIRTTGNQIVVPNANGGFQIFNPGPGRGGQPQPQPQPDVIGVTPQVNPVTGNPGRGAANAARQAAAAEQVANISQQLAQRLQQVGAALSSSAGDIRIVPEEASNSLLIRATAEDWALIQQLVQTVDLRPLQVLIEVTIAEVKRTRDLDVGVSGSATRTPKGATKADVTATQPSNSSARDFIFELTGGNGTIKYDVAINALASRGDVRVLSLPVIIAQNNKQATLNVGESRPFVQVSQTVPLDPTSRVQTVQYLPVGTVLTITPTINPDGYVNLVVSQTANSATNQVQFDAPIISQREASTQVFVRDGQTTVIGGLADNSQSRTSAGIPFLSRIPIVGGFLFGNTQRNDETSELFLFLTPHVISTDEDIDKVREGLKQGSELLKEVPVGARINPTADTLKAKPDTTRRRPPTDSLTTLRRRPPRDTTVIPSEERSDFAGLRPAPLGMTKL